MTPERARIILALYDRGACTHLEVIAAFAGRIYESGLSCDESRALLRARNYDWYLRTEKTLKALRNPAKATVDFGHI